MVITIPPEVDWIVGGLRECHDNGDERTNEELGMWSSTTMGVDVGVTVL